MQDQKSGNDRFAWAAFLAICFVVVGMAGIFAVYAAQAPLLRGLQHAQAIQSLATAQPEDADRLRLSLGDEYDQLMAAPGPTPLRLRAAQADNRTHFLNEAADIRRRLMIVIAVVTAAGALFGAMVLSVVRRART